jgi:hypothetical protein
MRPAVGELLGRTGAATAADAPASATESARCLAARCSPCKAKGSPQKILRRHERRRAENAGGLRNGQDQESEARRHNTKDEAVSVQDAIQ